MNRVCGLLLVLASASFGCNGAREESRREPSIAEEAQANHVKREAAKRELVAKLKADPQPVIDYAAEGVKRALPEAVGDDNAKTAVVTVDPKTLRTFGPEKWRVRGSLKVKDADNQPRDTTWEVEVMVLDGKLFRSSTNLDVVE